MIIFSEKNNGINIKRLNQAWGLQLFIYFKLFIIQEDNGLT